MNTIYINFIRATAILLAKGYMELEETLLQWKQQSHVLRFLEPPELNTIDLSHLTKSERIALGIRKSQLHEQLV